MDMDKISPQRIIGNQPRKTTPMPNAFNAVNRGVYIADNLAFLRALNDECVDLVCIDPPFAKNETFTGDRISPPLAAAEIAIERRLLASWGVNAAQDADSKGITWPDDIARGGYTDIWSWEADIHEDWIDSLEADYPSIHSLIETTRLVHSDDVAAYLCYMAIRLIEIHRVLKPTGSLYLHCDHTANGYLRQLIDAIFGNQNFCNEIVWCYRGLPSTAKIWQQKHDTILFYRKSEDYNFNVLRGEPTEGSTRTFRSAMNRGYNLNRSKRMVTVFDWDKYRAAVDAGTIPSDLQPKEFTGGNPPLRDWWEDIRILGGPTNRERTGYPTQKPVALAERIIKASTNEDDMVLDCFAGCAYVGVAAERLNRRWVACDFNPRAWTVFKRQFSKPSLVVLDCEDEITGQAALSLDNTVTVHGPNDLPARTTPIEESSPQAFALPEREFKVPASDIPNRVMLETLLEWSGYKAWCCGFANRRPDGSIVKTINNFHLDHIDPKSKRGSNQIWNRAPLCPTHNIRKGNQRIHLADYRVQIADAGEMLVDRIGDLVDLAEMEEKAHQYHMDYDTARLPAGCKRLRYTIRGLTIDKFNVSSKRQSTKKDNANAQRI